MVDRLIIGVDEVGRGSIAGDLLVCAYTFRAGLGDEKRSFFDEYAKDSKLFNSSKKREAAEAFLRECGLFVFTRRSPSEIDKSNIRLATIDAMREAALALRERLTDTYEIIFDGRDLPSGVEGPAKSLVKGDALIAEVSCASILAKVARDREMCELALIHPGYGFERHSGYGTKQHREAIQALGLCSAHRSWARKFLRASPKELGDFT